MKNKSDIVEELAEETGLTKVRAKEALSFFFDMIAEYLEDGEKVQIIHFGNFEVRERASRKGRNPQTGKEFVIDASKNPVFKASKTLKSRVNEL